MSELKVYVNPLKTNMFGETIVGQSYYLKSEADKVIANLEDELRAANEQIENLINSASSIMLFQDRVNDNKCDELRHQKYKRCMDNARWCKERYTRYNFVQKHSGFDWSREIDFYFRWHKRWLELAEKFKDKEAK